MTKAPARPFDVSTLLTAEPVPDEAETYAPTGSRIGQDGLSRGPFNPHHSQSAEPRLHDDQPVGAAPAEDAINPAHYRKHPSGIECIEVTRHMNFNAGNAVKYLWRYLDKGDPVENLKKAQWYIDDEIRRLEGKR